MAWQKEIKRMLSSGLTYELDALATKDFWYLTKQYLPRRLRERGWLNWIWDAWVRPSRSGGVLTDERRRHTAAPGDIASRRPPLNLPLVAVFYRITGTAQRRSSS